MKKILSLQAPMELTSNYNACFNTYITGKASPFDYVIPLSKYIKVVHHTCVSVGMRFRMLFDTEESSVHKYL